MQTHVSLLEVPKSSGKLQTRMRRYTVLASVIWLKYYRYDVKKLSKQTNKQ